MDTRLVESSGGGGKCLSRSSLLETSKNSKFFTKEISRHGSNSLNVNGHTLIPISRIKSGFSIRTTLFVNVEIPASLNYNNNNQKNTKLQSSEICQGIYCSMLSKDHDPDDSASEVKGKFSTSLPYKDSMKCPRCLNPFTEGRGIATRTLKISIKLWHS
ncbi:hypothetical protein CMV_021609 [Castanea mollissima]|uniref:Uncharacterized protein n=1 Tax=Castanea mollissima TaxID=60419 RepID=A0A8J4QTQ5_9ROSI|nr:hypothetical protein CMV_021609 [Castanea mollissima]